MKIQMASLAIQIHTVLLLEQLARLAKRIPSGLCAKVSSWTRSVTVTSLCEKSRKSLTE